LKGAVSCLDADQRGRFVDLPTKVTGSLIPKFTLADEGAVEGAEFAFLGELDGQCFDLGCGV